MPNIKDLPKHKRPREKLVEKGPENLTNAELLAIILRTGRKGKSALDLSKSLVTNHSQSIKKLLDLDLESLSKTKGIGPTKAITLKAANEFVQRANSQVANGLPLIESPQSACDQLTHIRAKKKEYFVVLYLNARNQLIHKETISIGTLDSSLVHPREVFLHAISHSAASLILAHNHPSGNLEPSDDDLRLTKHLVQAGNLLSIEIFDHLILSNDSHYSLKQNDQI